jgi:hypothetical protein
MKKITGLIIAKFLAATFLLSFLAGAGVVMVYRDADARVSIINKSAVASLAALPGLRAQQVAAFEQISTYEEKLAQACPDYNAECLRAAPAAAHLGYLESIATGLRNEVKAAYAAFDRAAALRPQALQDVRILDSAKLWSMLSLCLIPVLALLILANSLLDRLLNSLDDWAQRSRYDR